MKDEKIYSQPESNGIPKEHQEGMLDCDEKVHDDEGDDEDEDEDNEEDEEESELSDGEDIRVSY